MSSACMKIVQQHDPDRFLLSLFVPRKHRDALWALFAFNYEIAKTREVVTEQTIGLIRLQWWRDAIAEVYEGKEPRQHEVVEPLAKAVKQYDLPKDLFDNLIYAREFDLEGVAPANFKGLANYCEFTNAPLMQLVLMVLGEAEEDEVVKAVSVRYGMLGTLRAVPYMLSQGRVMLPSDVLKENDLSEKKILDFNKKEDLVEIIKILVSKLNEFQNDQLLIKSRFIHKLKVLTDIQEKHLLKFNGDVFDPKFQQGAPFKALKLWMGSNF